MQYYELANTDHQSIDSGVRAGKTIEGGMRPTFLGNIYAICTQCTYIILYMMYIV